MGASIAGLAVAFGERRICVGSRREASGKQLHGTIDGLLGRSRADEHRKQRGLEQNHREVKWRAMRNGLPKPTIRARDCVSHIQVFISVQSRLRVRMEINVARGTKNSRSRVCRRRRVLLKGTVGDTPPPPRHHMFKWPRPPVRVAWNLQFGSAEGT